MQRLQQWKIAVNLRMIPPYEGTYHVIPLLQIAFLRYAFLRVASLRYASSRVAFERDTFFCVIPI